MKQLSALALALVLAVTCLGTMACGAEVDATKIQLSDSEITVDGAAISTDSNQAVYAAHDIVYYQAGQGEDYGAGSADDEHTAEEAGAHTVVTIRKAGTYRVSGSLSAGQLAVDLGDDAKTAPSSVVTLILDGVDITCTVAPAVIFYNVYECGSTTRRRTICRLPHGGHLRRRRQRHPGRRQRQQHLRLLRGPYL